jgi:hypothetical protein
MYTWDGYSMPRATGWNFKVNLRLGNSSVSPNDTNGPVSVNLATGNVFTQTSSPTFPTVGGNVGLTYSYNSQQPLNVGLTAKYWPGCINVNAGSCPTSPYVVRTDPNIDFSWGNGSPDPSITDDQFRSQWTGFVTAPAAGTYCFETIEDDGAQVNVGGTLLYSRWTDHSRVVNPATGLPDFANDNSDCVSFSSGSLTKSITVDHYEDTGGADVQLWVKTPSSGTFIIPSSWFTTTNSVLPQGWQLSANTGNGLSYTKAAIGDSVVVLTDDSGVTHEFRRQDPTNTNSAWIPPADDDTTTLATVQTSSGDLRCAIQ